jgi:three-Cys-motif partner protein
MEKEKAWGGPWTEKKLDAFEQYVTAYLKIMNKQPQWKTIYFDGFAGSGKRKVKSQTHPLLFPISDEEQKVYRGTSERVVRMKPPYTFDFYYFVEVSETRLKKLKKKTNCYPGSQRKNTRISVKKL